MNKNFKGADHLLSADKNDLKVICDFKKLSKLSRDNHIEPSTYEKVLENIFENRFLFKNTYKKGEVFSLSNLIVRRPQGFLKPYEIKK